MSEFPTIVTDVDVIPTKSKKLKRLPERCCGHCEHWEYKVQDETGEPAMNERRECHQSPPQVLCDAEGFTWCRSPQTPADFWCGRGKLRKKVEP